MSRASRAGRGLTDGSEVRTAAGATVPLTADTGWINECFPVDGLHLHVSVFLVRADRRNIVIDSGSFHHRSSIERRLTATVGDEGLHAIILSHTDYPHAANVGAFRREWGDIEIIASSGAPEIQGLPYATKASIGGSLVVQGRTFSFLDPPLADRSHTSWIFDHVSRILYTADGFGSFHEPSACRSTSVDLEGSIELANIYRYHAEALPWLRYVDPDRLEAKLRGIFERFDVAFVAPVHGTPIAHGDLPDYLDRLVRAAARISREYRVPPS